MTLFYVCLGSNWQEHQQIKRAYRQLQSLGQIRWHSPSIPSTDITESGKDYVNVGLVLFVPFGQCQHLATLKCHSKRWEKRQRRQKHRGCIALDIDWLVLNANGQLDSTIRHHWPLNTNLLPPTIPIRRWPVLPKPSFFLPIDAKYR